MAFVCAPVAALASASNDETRLALVIGNSSCPPVRLATAANDAGLVAQSLAQIGFAVTAMGDVDAATLRQTVGAFVEKLRSAGARAVVVVYISGCGVQYDGENFLVPVGVRIDHQTDVPRTAVPLAELQASLEALPARARLFVYDLAHENAVAGADAMPLANGLTLVHAARNSLVAFNAAPGAVARPDVPPYGLYARALAEMLRTPGLTIKALFTRLRLRVAEITSAAVVPWDETDLGADVVLLPADSGSLPVVDDAVDIAGLPVERAFWTTVALDRFAAYQAFAQTFSADGLAARVKIMASLRLEAATWSEAVQLNASAAYWTYMQRYPRGPHYVDVRRRLAAMHAALEPPSRFEPYDFPDLPAPAPEPVRSLDRPDATFDPEGAPTPRPADDLLPQAPAATDLELAPPPLAPIGVLPIPAPLPAVATKAWPDEPGSIDEPFVPGLGLVSIKTNAIEGGAVMSLATAAGLITRTTVAADTAQRTILQTDAADEIVSRTTVTRADGPLITIVQTGPRGDVLATIVTRVDPLGERLTTIADGRGALVAEVRADRRGVLRDVTRGRASLGDATFVLPPLEDRSATPKVAAAPSIPAPSPALMSPSVPPAMPVIERSDLTGEPEPKRDTGPKSKASGVPSEADPLPKLAPPASAPATSPHLALPSSDPVLPKVPAPRPLPASDIPAAVPLPVPRPAPGVLVPRRGAATGHAKRGNGQQPR